MRKAPGSWLPCLPANRRSLRKSPFSGETLEPRNLLTTVTLSDYDQLVLELVNRARADPLAEVARNPNVADLNDGISGTLITSTPKQPLASVQALADAAELHSLDMLARDYFSHTTLGSNLSPTQRAAAQGYTGGVGENISWGGSTGSINWNSHTRARHDSLFTSPGHRRNLLRDNYAHVGMGIEFGQYTTSSNTYNASMLTQNFGSHSGNPYLTGVAFDDSVIDDAFYSIGESLEGIQVTATNIDTNQDYVTTTGASGGYQVSVPSGTYRVTASGGALAVDIVFEDIAVDSLNVKVDFDASEAPPPPPEPEPEPPNGLDLVGITGNQFWVASSDGTRLGTLYFGSLPANLSFTSLGTGDFNGDGLTDYASRATNGDLYVSLATGDTAFSTSRWGNFATVTTWETIVIGDFNGDGSSDIMGRADNDGSFWLARSNGTRFTNSRWGSLSTQVDWLNMEVGDFNGDGSDDIAGRAEDGTWWIARSNGSDRLLNSFWGRWSSVVTWSDIQVGDFNNDGLDDIMGRVNNTHFWVNRSSGNNYFFIEYWGAWANVGWQDVTVSDFDGDGNDDVAARVGGQWWIAISDGSRFLNRYWGAWSSSLVYAQVLATDVNGDGRADLLGRAPNGHWWLATSTGNAFTNSIATSWSTAVSWDGIAVGQFV